MVTEEKNENIIFIYGLKDPRDNKIRYVGWTKDIKKRLINHITPSRIKKNTHKNNWIKQLLSLNLKPEIIIIEEVSYDNRLQKEKYWINFYGRDNLTNSTDGGEGMCGFKHSEKTRKLISELKKGNTNMLGHHHSLETKKTISEKISVILKGRKPSEETKKKISESNKGIHHEWEGRKHRPESIEKMKNPHTPEEIYNMTGLKRPNATSQYLGVSFDKERSKWYCRIQINGKPKYIGRFLSEVEAAEAYNKAALFYYGEKAKINKLEKNEDNNN